MFDLRSYAQILCLFGLKFFLLPKKFHWTYELFRPKFFSDQISFLALSLAQLSPLVCTSVNHIHRGVLGKSLIKLNIGQRGKLSINQVHLVNSKAKNSKSVDQGIFVLKIKN